MGDIIPSQIIPAPRHVAIIMDGNGRWAKAKGLPRTEGHRQGIRAVRTLVEEARKLGVRYVTLFTFSTENWNRPFVEVKALMALFEMLLASEVAKLKSNNVRLRAIGDRDRLPERLRTALETAEEATRDQSGLDLILALSYGGRDEIIRGVKLIVQKVQKGELSIDDISEEHMSDALFAPDVPDPDLLIRTSGECRISNFLLWQLAYSEIVISPELWPDFSKEEFHRCLKEYGSRSRRFGMTQEQISDEQSQKRDRGGR